MTNSSDNKDAKDKSKTKRPKGPIRFEAIVPFLIFCIIVGCYFTFLFDTHLRWGLEKGLSLANGAEANIGTLNTSFLKASIDIQNIQITNPEKPATNTVQIGSIKFKALWDALLRGKLVIGEASVNEIAIATQRKSPGYVPPKPVEKNEPAKPGAVEKTAGRAAEQYKGNIFGDIAATVDGKGEKDQAQVVAENLKANVRGKQLQTELKAKEEDWKKKFEGLPKPKEVEALVQHLKEIKFSGKNAIESVQAVQEAQKTIKEIETKINQYQSASTEFQSDFNKYSNEIKGLESLIQEDINDLKARMNIPSLDAKSIAMLLFGGEINARLKQIDGYKTKYQKYMPPGKSKEEKEAEKIVAHERAKGKTYQFGRPKAYPLFWLKKAAISSKSSSEGFSGDVEGTLRDVSSDPKNLGTPITIALKGSFPRQQVMGLKADIAIDLSGPHAIETFTGSISSFPVEKKALSDSEDVKFIFNKAVGNTDINGKIIGGKINMDLKSSYKEIDYLVSAKNQFVDDVLKTVATDTKLITLNATATGDLLTPNIGINSNLAEAIGAGFRKQIDLKLKEVQDKIRKTVEDAVGKEKDKLTQQFNDLKGKYLGEIDKQKAALEKHKKVAQAKIDEGKKSQENQAKKQVEEKGQQVLDDLKKKFKF